MSSLNGKVYLMTGADGGMGSELAPALYAQGANLILHGQEQDRLEALAQRHAWDRARVSLHAHEVTDAAAVSAAVDRGIGYFGRLDGLINLAGINRFGGIELCSEEEWDAVMSTNVKGMFLTTRAAMPTLKNAGCGTVINMSSIWGIRGNGRMMAYSTSKHAVEGFTQSLRSEVAPWGVKVSSLIVGIVDNGFRKGMGGHVTFTEEQCQKMLRSSDVVPPILYILTSAPQALPSTITLEAWLLQ